MPRALRAGCNTGQELSKTHINLSACNAPSWQMGNVGANHHLQSKEANLSRKGCISISLPENMHHRTIDQTKQITFSTTTRAGLRPSAWLSFCFSVLAGCHCAFSIPLRQSQIEL